jgi:hypothetical protein
LDEYKLGTIQNDSLQSLLLRCLFCNSVRLVDMPLAIGGRLGHRAIPLPRG